MCQRSNWHKFVPFVGGFAILVLDTQISMHNFQEFVDYVFSFYGAGGLYDFGCSKEEIAFATLKYLDDLENPDTSVPGMTWGNGDSLDRERVRDYLMEIYGYEYASQQDRVNHFDIR